MTLTGDGATLNGAKSGGLEVEADMKQSLAASLRNGVVVTGHLLLAGMALARAGIIAPVRPDRLAQLLWRAASEGANLPLCCQRPLSAIPGVSPSLMISGRCRLPSWTGGYRPWPPRWRLTASAPGTPWR